MPEAIRAADVTKVYTSSGEGVWNVDLSLPEGSVVGLIGPSGSGKTTLVRLLTGLLEPDSGRIEVLGKDPARFEGATRSRIGYLPQRSALYPALSVRENLEFAAALHGMRGRKRREACDRVLAFVELEKAQGQKVSEISGGMRRRVGLATALVHSPELMFLDEPTAGLDPILRRTIWEHLLELRTRDRTLVVTTQIVGEAAYCDYIAVLSEGRVAEWGEPEELRRRAFGGELVDVLFAQRPAWSTIEEIADSIGATETRNTGPRKVRFTVPDAGSAIPLATAAAEKAGAELEEVERIVPEFDDVFVRIVDNHRALV